MVKIYKQLLPQSAKNVPGRTMKPRYITIHNTANTSKGANAKSHANYMSNGSGGRQASWHYTVDDKEIWQSLADTQQGWHAGDGRGPGNTQSIGIEICENSDGDFNQAVKNAAWLVRQLMERHNIPINNVVPHKRWSGKNCPRKLLSRWDEFIMAVKGAEYRAPKPSPEQKVEKSAPAKSKSGTKITVDGKWGKETTRALQKALGTPVDGIISRQLKNRVTQALYGGTVHFGRGGSPMVRALQKKVGAKADGYLGPETVRKTQQYLGTPVDGVISRPSSTMVKELQKRLNQGKF